MKLWLLEWIAGGPLYDVNQGFVVRAETEEAARLFAEADKADEVACGHHWTEPSDATCIELLPEGEAGIVLRDFNAG